MGGQDRSVTSDLDALLTALEVKIDDEITDTRWLGRPPRLTDPELVCLAVAQAMLGFTSESRWLRFVGCRLGERCFPSCRGGRAGTSGCGLSCRWSSGLYNSLRRTPTSGSTTTGSSNPPGSSAAGHAPR